MEVRINLSNKLFYAVVLVGVFVLLGAGVYAYNVDGTGDPTIMGHSSDEIETPGLPTCGDGEVLRMVGEVWGCGTLGSSCEDLSGIGTTVCEDGSTLKSTGSYSAWSGYIESKSYHSGNCPTSSSTALLEYSVGTHAYDSQGHLRYDCWTRTRTWNPTVCCGFSIIEVE